MRVNLFQLADSAFPIGGFVYSLGMESALNHGALKSNEDVRRYLSTYLQQLVSFDFPFLDAGYTFLNDEKEWTMLIATYEAMLMNPNIHKSSIVLGKNWLKLTNTLYPNDRLTFIEQYFNKHQLALHQVILMGLGSAALNIEVKDLRELFVYAAIRDQISALTRLGAIGPTGGQTLLTEVLREAEMLIDHYQTVPYEAAVKSGFVLDILQLSHHKVYSKLFQN